MSGGSTLAAMDDMPLVAILRGLVPEEAVAVGEALYDAGFRCLEVPLNSPRPLESIALLRQALDSRALVGAGTVLTADQVAQVADAGGQIVVSPNADAAVIRASKERGLLSLPGVCTPTEAFQALAAGADGLKLFPAEIVGIAGMKAMLAVLPQDVRLYAVGGINVSNMATWTSAGATGFGIGSSLFKAGQDLAATRENAAAFARAARWST